MRSVKARSQTRWLSSSVFCLFCFYPLEPWPLTLTFVINTSVLWNHGPSDCYPSLLHRGRTTKGHVGLSSLYGLSYQMLHVSSTVYGLSFSIPRTFRLLRVFHPFRYNRTLLLCVFLFSVSYPTSVRSRESSAAVSRSYTSPSDVRRTRS